jgi:hypothetical protein
VGGVRCGGFFHWNSFFKMFYQIRWCHLLSLMTSVGVTWLYITRSMVPTQSTSAERRHYMNQPTTVKNILSTAAERFGGSHHLVNGTKAAGTMRITSRVSHVELFT